MCYVSQCCVGMEITTIHNMAFGLSHWLGYFVMHCCLIGLIVLALFSTIISGSVIVLLE